MGDTYVKKKRPTNKTEINRDSFDKYRRRYYLSSKWRGRVDTKLNLSAPYYLFLSGVENVAQTYEEDLTITFPELLDKSLGNIEHSLHINFMIELQWLLAQYRVNDYTNPSITLLYGVSSNDFDNLPPNLNVTAIRVKSPYPFGHHHTKMTIFYYSDKSIRFAVYTANLIESDWEHRTQGVWISPKCSYLGDNVPVNYGESESLFKVDVIHYLNSYRLPELYDWLNRIQKSDCSSIRVCFLGSIPGQQGDAFGHLKLRKLVKEHSSSLELTSWNLVAQCSSIGSLGQSADCWLFGEFSSSLLGKVDSASHRVSVIYPSVENVRNSIQGMFGGACLPYSSNTHKKQLWLNKHLMQWKSDERFRSKAVPHIKSYAKISTKENKVAWFLLTSANLSKAAWGKCNRAGFVNIMSYEAGVAFFPKLLIGKDHFSVKKGGYTTQSNEEFPLPYDLPLIPYGCKDEIFLYDKHMPH